MTERGMLMIDGPNPASASLAEWETYAAEVRRLIAEGEDFGGELADAERWIEKRRREALARSAA